MPKGWAIAARGILITIALAGIGYALQLPLYLGIPVLEAQYLGVVLSLSLAAVFLLVPGRTRARQDSVPWYDVGLALLSVTQGAYVVWQYPQILRQPGMTPWNVGLGAAAVVILLEATRRTLGWALVSFALGSMALAFWGYSLGLHLINYPWQRWLYFFYLDENGIYGNILALLSTVVFAFVVFGRVLVQTGGGQALIDLTMALVGRYTGGPAKAAVLASGLMGTVTGSIAVNAVTVGTITIPLMKQAGYRPAFAAGVESAASTGGPLLPPVMGVTAFLMAQFLGIPYYQVALAAFFPAVIYYVVLFLQVHTEAQAMGLGRVPADQLPGRGAAAVSAVPFLAPLAVIVYALFVLQLAPETVALAGAATAVLVGLGYPSARKALARVHQVLEDIGRSFLDLALMGGVAGLIVSSLVLSGIGLSLVSGLRDMAGGSLFLLLVLAAVANLILGLGLPAIVTYVVLAVLVTPGIAHMGVPVIAAHLFTLYFAVAAELTPPAGAPIFITMAIAEAPFLRTALSGLKLAAGIFILPFAFVSRPGLLAMGSLWTILYDVFFTALGVSAIALCFEGFFRRRLSVGERTVLAVGGAACLAPRWDLTVFGALVVLALGAASFLGGRSEKKGLDRPVSEEVGRASRRGLSLDSKETE